MKLLLKNFVVLCLLVGTYSLNKKDFNIVNWKNFIEMQGESFIEKKMSFLEANSKTKAQPAELKSITADAMATADPNLIPTIDSYSVTDNMNSLGTLPENYISPAPKTLARCFKIEQSWLDNCQVKWDMYKYARGNSQGYGMYTPFCWWILNTEGDSFCKDENL